MQEQPKKLTEILFGMPELRSGKTAPPAVGKREVSDASISKYQVSMKPISTTLSKGGTHNGVVYSSFSETILSSSTARTPHALVQRSAELRLPPRILRMERHRGVAHAGRAETSRSLFVFGN
jgi:hypothetical protein